MYTVPARRATISAPARTAATGDSSTPAAIASQRVRADWWTPRAPLPAQRLVEVGVAREQADQALQPADHDLPGPHEGDPLDLEARFAEPAAQARGGEVHEVARACRGAASDRRRLRPAGCRCSGTATTTTPPGASRRAAWRIASPGSGRCSSECQKMTAAHSPFTSASGSSRRSSRAGFRSSPVASRPRRAQRVDEGAVAGARRRAPARRA